MSNKLASVGGVVHLSNEDVIDVSWMIEGMDDVKSINVDELVRHNAEVAKEYGNVGDVDEDEIEEAILALSKIIADRNQ